MVVIGSELEQAEEQRAYRRRRLLRALRGYLLVRGPTRGRTFCILFMASFVGIAAVSLLALGGLDEIPLRLVLATYLSWPVFLWMIHDELRRTFEETHFIKGLTNYLVNADVDEFRENNELEPDIKLRFETTLKSLSKAHQENMSIFAIPIFCIFSAGLWLVWDLIRRSPWLLSEVLLDEYLLRRNAGRWELMPKQGGRNFLVFSGFYFVLFGLILFCLTGWLAAHRT